MVTEALQQVVDQEQTHRKEEALHHKGEQRRSDNQGTHRTGVSHGSFLMDSSYVEDEYIMRSILAMNLDLSRNIANARYDEGALRTPFRPNVSNAAVYWSEDKS